MIFIAFLIVDGLFDNDSSLEDIIALGRTHAEAVDLVMDAWRAAAEHYRLDPNSVYPEHVGVVSGAVGDAWVNGERQ